ncbi:MAG: VWA domain-containing protein, partial [Actinomycetota bacterium]|nr:VWA domain-containing protein [Actinomycetota bacterium]
MGPATLAVARATKNGGAMSLANPAALWLATLVVPIVALHVLRPRRLRQTVPSTYLWRTVAVPTSAASPWQRLRPSVLLFLQLLAVMLLALAAARPVVAEPTALAQHTVFIVDASASMGARDGEPLRIDR